MTRITCLTFDLDDTLWLCAPVIERAEQRFYRWLQERYPRITGRYDFDALIEHRKAYMQAFPELHHDLTRLRKAWIGVLGAEAGYGDEPVEEGFRTFWLARNEVEPFEEALAALATLSVDYTIGAITNGNADVHTIGIGHYFDFVVTSASAGAAKPHPDIFDAAVLAAGVSADAMVHVGDDPVRDVRGAQEAGLRAIWVNTHAQSWPGGPDPDAEIRHMGELESVLARLAG
ncbi:MAG: HAD family hydrolase [Gammaproteobacteria bacterium]